MCGRAQYVARGEPLRVTVCHCRWCQRRTGTAFGIEVVFARDAIAFSGQQARRYRHHSDESGRWLDVYFCEHCGCNLGFTLEAVPNVRTLPAGTFDDPSWMSPTDQQFRHVFVRSRREWGELSGQVEAYERHFR